MTGPHAPSPPCPKKTGSGPRRPAPRRGGRGRESAQPWTPLKEARGATSEGHGTAATARSASSQEHVRWGWWRVPTPAPPRRPRRTGSGPRPPAPRTGGWGRENVKPRHPSRRHEAPASRRRRAAQHNAQSQLTTVCDEGSLPGPHVRTPPHPRMRGSGPRVPPPRTGG